MRKILIVCARLFGKVGTCQGAEAGDAFHNFTHLLSPLCITVAVFRSHQFNSLGERLMAFRKSFQSFVDCHVLSPARWIRAKSSVAAMPFPVNGSKPSVLSPRPGISEESGQMSRGLPQNSRITDLRKNARHLAYGFLWLLLTLPLYSQQLQPVTSQQADCGKFIQPGITTAGTFTSENIDNRFAGCDGFVVTYSSNGFSAVSVLLQDAPLGAGGIAGTFVSFAGTIVSPFTNPTTATTQGETRATGYYPYIRIQVTTTGTGYLVAEIHGFKTNPNSGVGASGGGGSGCVGTTVTPCVVDGPDASGASPTKNPVAVAGLDTNNGNVIRPLLLDFFGGVLPGRTNVAPSSLGSTTTVPFFQSSNSADIAAGAIGMGLYNAPILPNVAGDHWALAPGDSTNGPLVQAQGPTAVGSTPTKPPVIVGGQDGANLTRILRTDGAGQLIPSTIQIALADGIANNTVRLPSGVGNAPIYQLAFPMLFNGTTWDRRPGNAAGGAYTQGPAASGAAKAGNPVQVGAVFNTTQPTVTNGQTVENQASARGSLLVTPGVEGFPVTSTVTGNATMLSGQQAVTNAAVALATNTVKNICVKALSTNTASVFIGPSGVTTATGFELAADDSYCGPVTNTNLIFVIAAAGGSTVSWFAQN